MAPKDYVQIVTDHNLYTGRIFALTDTGVVVDLVSSVQVIDWDSILEFRILASQQTVPLKNPSKIGTPR